MYHRNKVHTDEFWKYELAKHRRTVLDSKTNEDMWKKQLGKHASEQEQQEHEAAAAAAVAAAFRSRSLEIHDRKPLAANSLQQAPSMGTLAGNEPAHQLTNEQQQQKMPDDRWLEQIKRSTSTDTNQNSQVSAEMKLLALHSLQNSLQMMNMKLPPPPPPVAPLAPAAPVGAPMSPVMHAVAPNLPPDAPMNSAGAPAVQEPRPKTPVSPPSGSNSTKTGNGYLSLLAHLSAQRKAEPESNPGFPVVDQERSQSESSASIAPYLSDMKEESAANRTQMWLAQLGQYRQKSFQGEIDRNHEELWEEQIAKVRQNPVRSPLEPIEITIEDTGSNNPNKNPINTEPTDIRSGCKAVLPPLEQEEEEESRKYVAPPTFEDVSPPPSLAALKRPPTPVSPLVPTPPHVISIKTSAIQRVENQPRTFSVSLEVNNNDILSEQPRRHIPVPLLPTSRPPLNNPPPVKRRLLEIPEDELSTEDHDVTKETPRVPLVENPMGIPAKETPVAEGDGSVLKFLLMDRMPRKRTHSPAMSHKSTEAKRLSFSGESDILRRRLLGIKSEEPPQEANLPPMAKTLPPMVKTLPPRVNSLPPMANTLPQVAKPFSHMVEQPMPHIQSLPPKPRFLPPTATITSQQLFEQQQQQKHDTKEPGQYAPVDLSKSEPLQQPEQQEQEHPQMKNYTQTSVLKHLLYRYNHSTEEESSSSS